MLKFSRGPLLWMYVSNGTPKKGCTDFLLLSEVFVGVSKISDYPVQLLTPCSGVRKDWAKLPVEILQVRVEIVGH